MSLAEIKRVIGQLRPEERTALTAYLVQEDNAAWDEQIDHDAATGRLDHLFAEAEQERASEDLRDWPAR